MALERHVAAVDRSDRLPLLGEKLNDAAGTRRLEGPCTEASRRALSHWIETRQAGVKDPLSERYPYHVVPVDHNRNVETGSWHLEHLRVGAHPAPCMEERFDA